MNTKFDPNKMKEYLQDIIEDKGRYLTWDSLIIIKFGIEDFINTMILKKRIFYVLFGIILMLIFKSMQHMLVIPTVILICICLFICYRVWQIDNCKNFYDNIKSKVNKLINEIQK